MNERRREIRKAAWRVTDADELMKVSDAVYAIPEDDYSVIEDDAERWKEINKEARANQALFDRWLRAQALEIRRRR